MPYKQDSGERNHRRKISEDAYFHKSNKRIFRAETQKSSPKPEKKPSNDSTGKDAALSLKEKFLVISANLCFPILGGIVYFLVITNKGYHLKATQSVGLSLVASLARIYIFIVRG